MIDVWINCPDEQCARSLGRALVEERLAACANVFPTIWSTYRWAGAVETTNEVPLLVKSRGALWAELVRRVESLHPYDVPSIVAVPGIRVNEAYARWLKEETRTP